VLFPDSFNVWDSLGEAYAKSGNKEKAKECYEKSIALNPSNETGKKALAELK
jgi:cytochrome c-type biogenesis protein CcmH/NrfG